MTFLNPVDRLEDYLQTAAPSAIELDENPDVLRSSLQDLADLNLLALRVPEDWHGLGVNEATFYTFQERIARYSGALAFLQTQHQSAASLLVKSQNQSLKQAYLPSMGNGQKLVGIGFSHLRRADNPPIKAIALPGGYRLHGQVPWVTGFGFFQTFIAAAVLPDGQAVYGMVPFNKTQQSEGEILLSEPMPLAAMNSTQTVAAHLTEWILPDSEVVFVQPAGAIHQSDRLNVLNHSFFALGCAQAGLDLLENIWRTKPFLLIAPVLKSLTQELNDCRQQIYTAQQQGESFEEKLCLRVWAIDLANRCAQAAVTVSSGAANSKYHPAQRIYREALVFTVSGQTTAVMEKTLDRLVRSSNQT
ncbi:acyl-CoA dehydrogenase family protein [Phormidesmis priestleyi]